MAGCLLVESTASLLSRPEWVSLGLTIRQAEQVSNKSRWGWGWRIVRVASRWLTDQREHLPEGLAALVAEIPESDKRATVAPQGGAQVALASLVYLFEIVAATPAGSDKKPKGQWPKRKRGGQKKYDAGADEKLAKNWGVAKRGGTYKADFARDNGLILADFSRLLNRVRSRKS